MSVKAWVARWKSIVLGTALGSVDGRPPRLRHVGTRDGPCARGHPEEGRASRSRSAVFRDPGPPRRGLRWDDDIADGRRTASMPGSSQDGRQAP